LGSWRPDVGSVNSLVRPGRAILPPRPLDPSAGARSGGQDRPPEGGPPKARSCTAASTTARLPRLGARCINIGQPLDYLAQSPLKLPAPAQSQFAGSIGPNVGRPQWARCRELPGLPPSPLAPYLTEYLFFEAAKTDCGCGRATVASNPLKY
jgi:hypothetical protein